MYGKERITNRSLIRELLPVLEQAIARKDEVKLDHKSYYGHPCSVTYINGLRIDYTDYEGTLYVEVTKTLHGKYDHATLAWHSAKPDFYGYSKEYTGMGNGYYADVSKEGEIIRGEWD